VHKKETYSRDIIILYHAVSSLSISIYYGLRLPTIPKVLSAWTLGKQCFENYKLCSRADCSIRVYFVVLDWHNWLTSLCLLSIQSYYKNISDVKNGEAKKVQATERL